MLRRAFALAALAALALAFNPALADDVKPGTHEGKVVKAEAGKLTMTDKDGKNEHTHTVPAAAKVTCDGKDCKVEDLKPGNSVRVTTEKKETRWSSFGSRRRRPSNSIHLI
jgi:Cu/Ag efflux protein CusF